MGYDWFASSVFLIMMGNKEKTLTCLQQFSRLLVSAFLWIPRLHSSVRLQKMLHPDKITLNILNEFY